MRKLILIVGTMLALATPLAMAESNIPAQEKPCDTQLQANRGCCSWHGGVCGCSGGGAVCCDGTMSPSCGCRAEDTPIETKPLPTDNAQ